MHNEILAGTVTALKIQKKNPNRVNVYLDDQFGLGLHKTLASELRVGQGLSQEEINSFLSRDEVEKAYQRALRYLSRRPHAEKEIRDKLSRNRIPSDVCERVIDRLRDASLLDDAAFAEAWVEDRGLYRPRSAKALRHELKQKGVHAAAIDQALSEFDDEEAAWQAGKKAVRRYRSLPEETAVRRMTAYLARRGFSYRLARKVVDVLLTGGSGSEGESEVVP
ncbi:MAG: RecX family transcriptional regulator [Anaerolineales bacterium]|nr:RecX family transcriptional regulator [Anaerolineales bacterium]